MMNARRCAAAGIAGVLAIQTGCAEPARSTRMAAAAVDDGPAGARASIALADVATPDLQPPVRR